MKTIKSKVPLETLASGLHMDVSGGSQTIT